MHGQRLTLHSSSAVGARLRRPSCAGDAMMTAINLISIKDIAKSRGLHVLDGNYVVTK
jgi:hypothetical protein